MPPKCLPNSSEQEFQAIEQLDFGLCEFMATVSFSPLPLAQTKVDQARLLRDPSVLSVLQDWAQLMRRWPDSGPI